MSVGTVLLGGALLALVVAYLARPFRPTRAGTNVERAVEDWVAQVREEEELSEGTLADTGRDGSIGEEPLAINYCSQCGRQVGPDDRFCAGCGVPLQ
ncbi:MAG: zinc-ribbon domain-containing protein [Anaerolineae bacterium]|jgi:hypothetical protein